MPIRTSSSQIRGCWNPALSALGLMLGLGTAACVSQGTFDALAGDRAIVQGQRDALIDKAGALEQRVAELEGELQASASEKQSLGSALSTRQREIDSMRGTYAALVANLETELAAGQIEIERVRDGLRLNVADEILFPSASAQLDAGGREILVKVSSQLAAAGHRIEVIGHTDALPIGGRLGQVYPTNWELGAARAARVVRLLEEQGIAGQRLHAVSRSHYAPVANNETPDGRARNRRIEIRLFPRASAQATPLPAAPRVP